MDRTSMRRRDNLVLHGCEQGLVKAMQWHGAWGGHTIYMFMPYIYIEREGEIIHIYIERETHTYICLFVVYI